MLARNRNRDLSRLALGGPTAAGVARCDQTTASGGTPPVTVIWLIVRIADIDPLNEEFTGLMAIDAFTVIDEGPGEGAPPAAPDGISHNESEVLHLAMSSFRNADFGSLPIPLHVHLRIAKSA